MKPKIPTLEANETPFTSTDEVIAAISAPHYNTDPAYQASVRRRLDASNVI